MIRSMTGYGKAEGVVGNRKYNIEVRSLNSKQFDLNTRIPSMFREKEMELRKLLRSRVIRGKCDFFLFYELDEAEVKHSVNAPVVANYISQLKDVATSSGVSNSDLLALAMRMPEALSNSKDELDDKSWKEIEKLVVESLDKFDAFRNTEGKAIEEDFKSGINIIRKCSEDLDTLLDARLKRVRERIRTNLEIIDTSKIDESRFEQEVLFYIEKQDVSEERSRLAVHCDHFEEILKDGIGAGKKLGFVAQEIGREINTLGSKANDAEIQRVVVMMKDELEKIKEQILNVL